MNCRTNLNRWIGRSADDVKFSAALPPLLASAKGLVDPP